MKLLTKDTDYAIRALLVLASRPGEYVSVRKIAEEQDMPYQYLRRIMQFLISKRIVDSREGGGGGFRLVKDAAAIKVSDIITLFQGDIQLSECMFRKKICSQRAGCILRKNIQRIEEIVAGEFEKITIGSMLKDLSRQRNSGGLS